MADDNRCPHCKQDIGTTFPRESGWNIPCPNCGGRITRAGRKELGTGDRWAKAK